ncbi:MAG: ABC transporter permease [Candidatus Bathyarchaeota archaeon]|nr:ABC transporter permease [Candidatus Bathyarchaeota archaeon]
MRFWKSWIVTKKDLSVIRKNKYVLYSLIAMPVVLGVILPVIFIFSLSAGADQLPKEELIVAARQVVDLGSMYFVLIPAILPSIIASYSFVGEKIEKSLEPLLATPTTDGELLLGKSLAAFVPCMAVTYLAMAIFVPLIDYWTYTSFGLLLLPNVYWAILMFVITPLACVMSVLANVIISSRVSDIRAAQQLGGIVVLPLIFVVVFGSVASSASLMLAIAVSIALAGADIALFYLSKATFQREEILTKWK